MTVFKNRASVLAIVTEVTAGTYVAPSSGTQYIPLQEGFGFVPNFDSLENGEIRSGIGRAKPIQGFERPEATFDQYLKASGTAGTAPTFGPLLKAALGAETANSTERVTAGGSTVSVVALAAGGGDFARGFAVLSKTAVYEIRPVHSVSGNNLTLGFNLNNAPGAGIGMGKCVNYSVANEGHPTLSLTLYRGNGGAIEAIAGARVAELSFSIAASQLINMGFSLQGTKYFYNPVVIAAADTKLDFEDDDGVVAATIAAGTYRDPHEIAAAIQSAMRAVQTNETATVVYVDATGRYKITCTGTLLSLLWNTGANTANTIGDKIGFSVAADDTGTAAATGYTSDNAITLTNAITPTYDPTDPNAAKNNEVLIGDSDDTTCFCAASLDLTLTNTIIDAECVCAESGVQEKVISEREVTASIVGYLERYEADKFKKFRNNDDIRFCFNWGPKSGGNWVEGKCGNIYMPSASISAFELGDVNGLVSMNITVSAFMDSSGNGEFFMNFV